MKHFAVTSFLAAALAAGSAMAQEQPHESPEDNLEQALEIIGNDKTGQQLLDFELPRDGYGEPDMILEMFLKMYKERAAQAGKNMQTFYPGTGRADYSEMEDAVDWAGVSPGAGIEIVYRPDTPPLTLAVAIGNILWDIESWLGSPLSGTGSMIAHFDSKADTGLVDPEELETAMASLGEEAAAVYGHIQNCFPDASFEDTARAAGTAFETLNAGGAPLSCPSPLR